MTDKRSNPHSPTRKAQLEPLEQLAKENEQLRAQICEQRNEIERLEKLADTDGLTGLANRRHFERTLQQRFSEQQRGGSSFCLMLIDIDAFKRVNDRLGHSAGDRLLKIIGRGITKNLRDCDLVFRVGGDELAVLLPNSELNQSILVANRLIDQLYELFEDYRSHAAVGLSIGLTTSKSKATIIDLMESADRAMYQAKSRGGNRCTTDMDAPQD